MRQEEPRCDQARRSQQDGRKETLEERCDDGRAERHTGGNQHTRTAEALPDDVENELVPEQADRKRGDQPLPCGRVAEPAEQDAKPRHRDERIAQHQDDSERHVAGIDPAQRLSDRAEVNGSKREYHAHCGRRDDQRGPYASPGPQPDGVIRSVGVARL